MNNSDDIFTPPNELVAYLRWNSQRNRVLSASVGITLRDMYAEAADEIERLRAELATQQTMTAPRCTICAYPQEPELINVTNIGDELPQWVIGWQCNNYGLHEYLRKQQQ